MAVTAVACAPATSASDIAELRDGIVTSAPGVADALVRFRVDVFVQEVDVALLMPGTADEVLDLDNDASRGLLTVGADELSARYGERADS